MSRESAELRIGDVERDAAVTALGEHFAAGRLTEEEYDERSTVAWSARTRGDLSPLFADLPAPHAPRDRPAETDGAASRSRGRPPHQRAVRAGRAPCRSRWSRCSLHWRWAT